jgi:3-hydroxybutyryl-CoA dehydrogenase
VEPVLRKGEGTVEIKKVGVVGCGVMGAGIAQVCVQSGYSVVVSEVDKATLDKGLAAIASRLGREVEKGRLPAPDRDSALGRLQGTTDINGFSVCDLVIEAIVENMELKKKVFQELDRVCPRHAILATNTSVLSVTEIAAATTRPERVPGLHFFNPAPVMPLLEIVRTIVTDDETVAICQDFGKSLGKTTVVVRDTPGFIVNRLSVAFTLNAVRMLEAGIATREDIDNSVRKGLNHPMGPLELADMAGIDILYHVACDLYDKLKDPQYAPPVLLQKMFAAGWFGRKAGRGFYEYNKQ